VSTVTAVIPTRNRAGLLAQSLRSVRAQEGVELEIVVVDDASSDGTRDFLAEVDDPRLRVVRHESAKGIGGARNAGLEAAGGEWIAFLDDDDLWAPAKLRAQLSALADAPACRWACVGAVYVDADLRVIGGLRLQDGGRILERMLASDVINGSGSSALFSTDLLRDLGGFREDLDAAEDWECFIRVAESSELTAVDRPLMAYRAHAASYSHDVARQQRAEDRVRELHAGLASRLEVPRRPSASSVHFARQEMRAGLRVNPARRYFAAARNGKPRYYANAAAALLSPRASVAIGIRRWRRSLDESWLAEAETWLSGLRGEVSAP
jgi:glycosyltransferase involved in cell wall biosynthesis